MSTLQERLDRIKKSFVESAPAEVLAVMDGVTETLRASGIESRLPAVGSALPAFELSDTAGQLVLSTEILDQGSLILTFYRGLW